jgi:hypothetical protein
MNTNEFGLIRAHSCSFVAPHALGFGHSDFGFDSGFGDSEFGFPPLS